MEYSPEEGVARFQVRKKDLLRIAQSSASSQVIENAVKGSKDILIAFDGKPTRAVGTKEPPAHEKIVERVSSWYKTPTPPSMFKLFTANRSPRQRKTKDVPGVKRFDPETSLARKARQEAARPKREESSKSKRGMAREQLMSMFKDLTDAFKSLDIDGDGQVSLDEMKEYFRKKPEANVSSTMLEEWFAALDLDGDGTLSYNELSGGMQMLEEPEDFFPLSTTEYWFKYQSTTPIKKHPNAAWNRGDASTVISFADSMDQWQAEREKVRKDRNMLKRVMKKQVEKHDMLAFRTEVFRANKKIGENLIDLGAARRNLHDAADALNLCIDPESNAGKDSKSRARAQKREAEKVKAANRAKQLSDMRSNFQAAKQDLSQEQQMHIEEVEVDPETMEARRLAKTYNLPVPDVEDLKKMFDKFDTDLNGSISKNELYNLAKFMRGGDEEVPAKWLHDELRSIDLNMDGSMDFEEYVRYVAKLKKKDDSNIHTAEERLTSFAADLDLGVPPLLYDAKRVREHRYHLYQNTLRIALIRSATTGVSGMMSTFLEAKEAGEKQRAAEV